MGKLHDRLRASGYEGHNLEVLLVRLLFCLFAEDTTLFEPRGSFRDFIENCTQEDGHDLGSQLSHLFQILNQKEERRQKNLDEMLAGFPYVNGRLFAEALPIPSCDSKMREGLLDCCALDWGRISPAIFGALFQCVMDEEGKDRRRNLGAHYTSEENILKLIKPLFLDDLWAEFEAAKRSSTKLFELHKKLARLKFLDPACGCGNFLVIAYRELRKLELEVLRAARVLGPTQLDVFQMINVNVDQFFGIEIEEFPAQIAQVALWLTDHQMNMMVSEEFGQYFRRLPLVHAPNIVCGNALRMDWNDVVSVYDVDYIFGNPPFVGKQHQNNDQKTDMESVFRSVKGAGVLDYVTAWYMKAVRYLREEDNAGAQRVLPAEGKSAREHVRIAFVSTNSITQGEQVGVLWTELLRRGVKIHFAHRTFRWSNEARGKAAVHCVIIGWALHDIDPKTIFDYPAINGEPHALRVGNINPYLVNATDVALGARRVPLCAVPEIVFGSMPNDGGNLLLSEEEKQVLLNREPAAEKWVRPFMGATEYINQISRWCLWLVGISPAELRELPEISKRVELVKRHRLDSDRNTTKALAEFPTLFGEIRQPKTKYILVPCHSSEERDYIPLGFMSPLVVCGNANLCIPSPSLFVFGVMSSDMHMAWVKYVCGRIKSDYRYTAQIVYNNFPWPSEPTDKQKEAIESAAQGVLDGRAAHPDASLADLYDPIAMPPDLRKAHQALDKAVDVAYGKKSFTSDAERVAFLFELYHKYTSLLPPPEKTARKGRRKAGK